MLVELRLHPRRKRLHPRPAVGLMSQQSRLRIEAFSMCLRVGLVHLTQRLEHEAHFLGEALSHLP